MNKEEFWQLLERRNEVQKRLAETEVNLFKHQHLHEEVEDEYQEISSKIRKFVATYGVEEEV